MLSDLGQNVWLALQVALGLGFVIFVHELGHFLAAKTFGVRCDKFYVGFDVPISIGPIKLPSTLGKFQWGETEYGIGIIPLGGYVKMLGQDDDPRKAEEEASKLRMGEGEDAPLDPRSYPAKPVWQRMIIISAGVIMNLIFAVILAGAAYWSGVPYTPAVVGSVYSGGPAWQAGLAPGDQILQVGNIDEDLRKLRYDDFATEVISHGFEFKDAPLPIVYESEGERIETTASPTPRYHPDGFYLVGLTSSTTPTIGSKPFTPDSFLSKAQPNLMAGDRIVAVNGEELPAHPQFDKVTASELTSRFQANWESPVTVTVERTPEGQSGSKDVKPEIVEVELPPVPVKSLGIGFKLGPVTALQSGSLAAASELQVGDVIKAVNGEPVEDGLKLPSIVGRLAGQPVKLTVMRGSDEQIEELEIEIAAAKKPRFDPIPLLSGEMSLGELGVAFSVSPVVTTVDDSDQGIEIGDTLKQIQWVLNDEQKEELESMFNERSFESLRVDDEFTVACLYDLLQNLPEDAQLRCVFERDGKMREPLELTTKYAEDWYWHVRGIAMTPLMDNYKAASLSEAATLGLWETSRRFKGVLNFLRLLVTGRIGTKGLGGPGRIAYVAAAEASYGPSRLLLFLTMLSANLAILNFLPIPALDGGHMVFLTAEAIRGKPVSEALQVRLTMVGVLGLLSLMAFVIVKDIIWFAS
ncbi:MAG: site-2 protease family protein [Pirellulaceae bacterium]